MLGTTPAAHREEGIYSDSHQEHTHDGDRAIRSQVGTNRVSKTRGNWTERMTVFATRICAHDTSWTDGKRDQTFEETARREENVRQDGRSNGGWRLQGLRGM